MELWHFETVVWTVVSLDSGSWEVVTGLGGRSELLGRLLADWPDRPLFGETASEDDRSGRSRRDSRGDRRGLAIRARLEDLESQITSQILKSLEVKVQN